MDESFWPVLADLLLQRVWIVQFVQFRWSMLWWSENQIGVILNLSSNLWATQKNESNELVCTRWNCLCRVNPVSITATGVILSWLTRWYDCQWSIGHVLECVCFGSCENSKRIETNQQNLRVLSSRSISRYHHYPSCSNHTKLVPHSNFSLQIFRLTVKNRFCFTATKTRGLATRDQDRERLHTTTVCPIDWLIDWFWARVWKLTSKRKIWDCRGQRGQHFEENKESRFSINVLFLDHYSRLITYID